MEPFNFSLDDFERAAARVYEVLSPSPQLSWPLLNERTGCDVLVKHENHLPTGAFKVRGGICYAGELAREHPETPGVIAATRGNHGQSVAFSAARHGLAAVIVVPHGNSREKNRAMQGYGAELIEHGRDFDEALVHARALAESRGLHMFQSFDPQLVCGVGTYGIELLRAAPDLDAVYVPLGLGSGACGLIAARHALGLQTEVIAVTAGQAPAYALSFAAGEVCETTSANTLADGLAVRIPHPQALEFMLTRASRVVTVSETEILDAMAFYFTDTHNVAEGAAAAALAALLQEKEPMRGKKIGLILSGGNVDAELFAQALSRGRGEG
ncbi:MAG: threonine dehydratase [Lentisphaeria bacterium]|jgi:threonine dehydratase|nr:threonine dehydratase [Lentisphaeria bacterium]